MMSLSGDTQAGVIEALNSTSRYLDKLLNIDNPYFEGMVSQIYPVELQLNKVKFPIRRPRFRYTFINFRQMSTYDKRGDFYFDIVKFPFLDGDVSRTTSFGVYISQLIRFARVSSHLIFFNTRIKSLTAKLLQQWYRYHKLRSVFLILS